MRFAMLSGLIVPGATYGVGVGNGAKGVGAGARGAAV